MRFATSPTSIVPASSPDGQATSREGQQETRPFPFLDLKAQFSLIKDEVMKSIQLVMESQQFILGPEVRSFEEEMRAFVGTQAAVGCASGSDALVLALLALGIGSDDEVITTPFTFVATAGSVARVGAKPVFVDILPETFNIDPGQIEAAITGRTRAIIPVHLFGLAADMNAILTVARDHKLPVIEDAAQALGARYQSIPVGRIGTLGCFSFFPSKNLGGAGDGGMVTTNDSSLSDRLRLLRVHGSRTKYFYDILGTNSRLDSLQAAILRVKLRHLAAWTCARQEKAETYRKLLVEHGMETRLKFPFIPANCFHVFNQFVLRCPARDSLRDFLRGQGIPTEVYYPLPLHLQPAFAYLGYKAGEFPAAEAASREVLALPIYPELSMARQAGVVQAMAKFYGTAK